MFFSVSLPRLRHHIRNNHETNLVKSFTCKQGSGPCQRSFSSLKSLYRHINQHHCQSMRDNCDDQLCNNEGAHDETENSSDYKLRTDPPVNMDFDLNELSFILSLYAIPTLNRKNIVEICAAVSDLIHRKFDGKCNMFENLDSEHKINVARDKLNLRIAVKSCVVGYSSSVVKDVDSQSIRMKGVSAQIISLRETFQMLFSVPLVLETAKNYLSNVQTEILTDSKDGSVLNGLPPLTFPFVLFFDELETGNVLGSKKGINKLGFIYASLRCFPPHMYSYLTNIYSVAAIPSIAMRSISEVLSEIVNEIKSLAQEGISVNGVRIFFHFLGLIGDNLGQHQVLGFVESFSANFPCISCKLHRNECQRTTNEVTNVLRDRTNYNEDITLDEPSETGIKSLCIFNELPNYHVTENIIFDVMHDVLEGVANFGMTAVISHVTDKFLPLETLDNLVQNFPFRNLHTKPAHIKARDLKNPTIPQSASEMLSLTLYFSLIVGDYVPLEDEVWHYYLVLQKIVCIITLKSISKDVIDELDSLISEHHQLYIKLFDKNLRPKHHHMLHYKNSLLKFGPLCHLWAMRFEGKNYLMKLYGQVIRCRANICKSLLIRDNYSFSFNILKLRHKVHMHDDVEHVGPVLANNNFVSGICYKYIKLTGYKYEIGTVFASKCKSSNLFPELYRIKYILFKDAQFWFIATAMDVKCYCPHTSSYEGSFLLDYHHCIDVSEVSKPLIYVLKGGCYRVSSMEF